MSQPGPVPQGSWQRVHPLTPYVRSWLIVVAVVWGVVSTMLDDILKMVMHQEPMDVNLGGTVQVIGVGVLIAGLLTVVGVILGLGFLSWWFTRYQVTAEHVKFRSGWLFRTQRQARLDKVQGIDVERKFLPRILGLASLKFDVADGGSSVLELSFLGKEHAQQLRHDLLVAVQQASSGQGPDRAGSFGFRELANDRSREIRVAQKLGLLSDQEEGRRIFTVPTARVLLGMVFSGSAIFLVLSLVTAGVLLVVNPAALLVVLPGNVPILLMAISGLYNHLERGWGFTLSEVPTGVRVRHGLLNERSSTIPVGRVQAVQVTRPWLWRPFRGFKVVVTTAGKGGDATEALQSTVVPVGTWENVQATLDLVVPVTSWPRDMVYSGLLQDGVEAGYVTSPRRARFFDPFTWRYRGFTLTSTVLLLRWGRLGRKLSVIPHHKTQSLRLSQGPLERRLKLADLTVDLVAGPVSSHVYHLDVGEAQELAVQHTCLSHEARERVRAEERARETETPWARAFREGLMTPPLVPGNGRIPEVPLSAHNAPNTRSQGREE